MSLQEMMLPKQQYTDENLRVTHTLVFTIRQVHIACPKKNVFSFSVFSLRLYSQLILVTSKNPEDDSLSIIKTIFHQ